jgi:hypothetical protein
MEAEMAADVFILGGAQTDFARNLEREGGNYGGITVPGITVRELRCENYGAGITVPVYQIH